MPIPLPRIPKADPKVREALRAHRLANPRPLSPCVDQTPADIARYYRTVEIGGTAVIRHTQGHMLRYDIQVVEGRNPQRGIVYILGRDGFYAKSGKNTRHPTGQTTLVVPTPEVLAWAEAHPRGEADIAHYRDDGNWF